MHIWFVAYHTTITHTALPTWHLMFLNYAFYVWICLLMSTDIDECASGAYTCHRLASCVNTVGSYSCSCTQPYTGDGKTCNLASGESTVYPFDSSTLYLIVKASLHRWFLSQQLNAIFVAPKLQLQNRTCKPLCHFCAILAISRRGMRYNSRNTVTLSSIFTCYQAHSFSLRNRRVLTFILTNCTKIAMKSQLVATLARQKLHWVALSCCDKNRLCKRAFRLLTVLFPWARITQLRFFDNWLFLQQ